MLHLGRWITLALLVTAALGMLVGYRLGGLNEPAEAATTATVDCTTIPPLALTRRGVPGHPDDVTTLRAYARRQPAAITVVTETTPSRELAVTLAGNVVSQIFPDGAVSVVLNSPPRLGADNAPDAEEKLKRRAAELARRMAHCLLQTK